MKYSGKFKIPVPLLQKRVRVCSSFGYFKNYKQEKFRVFFLEQLFNYIIFSENISENWPTTKTRKDTMISHFPEYFIHFILFHHFDNFMSFYLY